MKLDIILGRRSQPLTDNIPCSQTLRITGFNNLVSFLHQIGTGYKPFSLTQDFDRSSSYPLLYLSRPIERSREIFTSIASLPGCLINRAVDNIIMS